LEYLRHPAEILQTATCWQTGIVILGTIILWFLFFLLYKKRIAKPTVERIKKRFAIAPAVLLLGSSLIFIGMRGGVSYVNISQSAAYFSKSQMLNDAAVNTPWNLVYSMIKSSHAKLDAAFIRMDKNEAENMVKQLYVVEQDTTISILKEQKVNIVFILLESWSADLIASLGGEAGITPHFAELEKEGLLFTQVYANGHRSQQGIEAVLSGYPPVPIHNITNDFAKFSGLNSIVKDLKTAGYSASFHFGGDLIYGNIKAYLMSHNFDQIIDMYDFPLSIPRGKLAIPDEYLFDRQLADVKKLKEPFFSMIFTGSTHSPYDHPKLKNPITWDVPELPYINSAKYCDEALGAYFQKVRNEPWYPNTLFILIADHSHPTYRQRSFYTAEYQHIPLLLFGEVLKDEYRGKQWDQPAGQIDLPATLLKQLGMPFEHYTWSFDMMNRHHSAFIPAASYHGLSWITPSGYISHDAFNNYPLVNTFTDDSLFNVEYSRCRAFLQVLYLDYLNR
jgi:phosphoglycerol transferase MdoB-like AlkP superfamily enzyme